jgi:hypothetical protein
MASGGDFPIVPPRLLTVLKIKDSAEGYLLPDVGYGYADLEPHIDEATMRLHHSRHHAGYTKKTNAALEAWRKSVQSFAMIGCTTSAYALTRWRCSTVAGRVGGACFQADREHHTENRRCAKEVATCNKEQWRRVRDLEF